MPLFRSLAPSVLRNTRLSTDNPAISKFSLKPSESSNSEKDGNNGEITISRLPLFGFLEIPEALNKQFKIPSGCVLTEKSIALRKVKTLGPSRVVNLIRPGDYVAPLP